ncbi:hypothetical protein DYH09_32105 [bacterium CPR1]|nr:hypothetical protein [bacterium CPR1]
MVVERALKVQGLPVPSRNLDRDALDDLLLAIASPLRLELLHLDSEAILRALALGEAFLRYTDCLSGKPPSLQEAYQSLVAVGPALRLLAQGDEPLEFAAEIQEGAPAFHDAGLVFSAFLALRRLRSFAGVLTALEGAIRPEMPMADRSALLMRLGQHIEITERKARRALRLGRHDSRRRFQSLMPRWDQLLEVDQSRWDCAIKSPRTPRVLMAGATGGDIHTTPFESMLAAALTLRGAEVNFFLCDQSLPACSVLQGENIHFEEFLRDGPRRRMCPSCWRGARDELKPLSLPIHRLSTLLEEGAQDEASALSREIALEEIRGFEQDSVAIGEHAFSGAVKFLAVGRLPDSRPAELILRRFFRGALLTAGAVRSVVRRFRPDVAVLNHGVYVPCGPAQSRGYLPQDLCRRTGE